MEGKFCQSCGMPMGATNEMYGVNVDGSLSDDYCKYCFDKGEYTEKMTMEEMIGLCIPHVLTANPSMSEEDARKMMQDFFPVLKRWKD